MSREAIKEVERFLREGRKIAAIKYLQDSHRLSLNQAKILVNALEPKTEISESINISPDEVLKADLKALLESGKKIEAIKKAKDTLGLRLPGAKVWVEDIEREMNSRGRPVTTDGRNSTNILLWSFTGVGLLMMGIATYVYYNQSRFIQHSDVTKGKVVSLQNNDEDMSAPVIEYEWRGEKRVYTSSTYTSPPAFTVNEEVPVYVNRQNPDDILVDTFSERWLLTFILGCIGSLFVGIPLLIIYFSPRHG